MNRLEILQADIAGHLEDICKLFTQRPKITIVIRTPWLPVATVGKTTGTATTARYYCFKWCVEAGRQR